MAETRQDVMATGTPSPARLDVWWGVADEHGDHEVAGAEVVLVEGPGHGPAAGPGPTARPTVPGLSAELVEGADRERLRTALRDLRAGWVCPPVPALVRAAHGVADVRLWLRPGPGPGEFMCVTQTLGLPDTRVPEDLQRATTRLLERWQRSDDDGATVGTVRAFLSGWSAQPQAEDVRRGTRSELAQDLHDGAMQLQHLLVAQIEGALEVAASGEDPSELLRQMRHTARRAVDELRGVVAELDPRTGREADVAGELRTVVRLWQEDGATVGSRRRCTVHLDPLTAPETTAVALRRVLAECLNNVAKHAAAGRVVVRLAVAPGEARLTVTDDGVGFDVGAHRARVGEQRGVAGMHTRMEALGGGVEVTSTGGRGSSVTAWVPL